MELYVTIAWRHPWFSGASKFRLALVQLQVSLNKEANVKRAAEMVKEAAGKGAAQMIALPVSWLAFV